MARDYNQVLGGNKPGPSLGQKFEGAAHRMKQIWDVGSGIYHAAKFVAPIVSALL
jgi:hypothetical protein